MDVYTHEKEQIEGIKEWWRENRWYLLGGVIAAIALVGGWRYWQAWQVEQAEAASAGYSDMLIDAGARDLAAVREKAGQLREEYSGTPYAALAVLRLAALEVESDEFEAAAESLRWAMENSRDEELALVARLRLARVQLQLGNYDDAIALVTGSDSITFKPLFEEVRGDALLLKGDRDGASAAYEAALAAVIPGVVDTQRLERKRENVQMPLDVLALGDEREQAETQDAAGNENAE